MKMTDSSELPRQIDRESALTSLNYMMCSLTRRYKNIGKLIATTDLTTHKLEQPTCYLEITFNRGNRASCYIFQLKTLCGRYGGCIISVNV